MSARFLVALLCLCAAAPAVAQVPVVTPQQQPEDSVQARADSIVRTRAKGDSVRPRPPISPSTAFFRSLLVPGWGQSTLGRNGMAGIFVGFEGFAAIMVWKSSWQLNYARARNKYVKSHTQEQQDWIVLLIFNHLMSGAEAYVSAHLYDFPATLKMRAMPNGQTGVGINVGF